MISPQCIKIFGRQIDHSREFLRPCMSDWTFFDGVVESSSSMKFLNSSALRLLQWVTSTMIAISCSRMYRTCTASEQNITHSALYSTFWGDVSAVWPATNFSRYLQVRRGHRRPRRTPETARGECTFHVHGTLLTYNQEFIKGRVHTVWPSD